jgi:hypothetical protein
VMVEQVVIHFQEVLVVLVAEQMVVNIRED